MDLCLVLQYSRMVLVLQSLQHYLVLVTDITVTVGFKKPGNLVLVQHCFLQMQLIRYCTSIGLVFGLVLVSIPPASLGSALVSFMNSTSGRITVVKRDIM